jgi:large subunit ribosomal protein L37Ae
VSRKAQKSPVGGLGVRYGRSVRNRIGRILVESRKKYACTSCGNLAVERSSVGVWQCRHCGNTFTGGAYAPTTKTGDVARRSARRT